MLQKTPGSVLFPKIFEPGFIGKLRLRNRLIKAPLCSHLASRDGCVTERMIRHYQEMARGGVGLVIVEYSYVDEKASKTSDTQLGVSSNHHRPGLEWLASTIKMEGALTCLQLCHAGHARVIPGAKTVSRFPWEGAYVPGLPLPEELTTEEIKDIIEAFGNAAVRAKSAGFDMVEVHGAHGYLITNSLSPRINKRTDIYGGSLNNRMRLLLEIIENIRRKAGPDFPLSVRLSWTDYEKEDPITLDDTKEVARALEKAGVNVIHISGGAFNTGDKEIVRMYWPRAFNVQGAEEVKKTVSIPIIASGAITSPELAENILEDGKADFISLGRPLLADPYFPLKAMQSRPQDIRPCIRCCDGCVRRLGTSMTLACSVNVAVGREEEFKIKPAAGIKKVAVVGGGPAGMEAARVAGLMGHKITLFERRKLGGMLNEASVPDFKADIRSLINYQVNMLKNIGTKVVYEEATSQTIKDKKFDTVIVATGGLPSTMDIPGANEPFVINALDVFKGAQTGRKIVVVGGGLIGSDAALFLAEQGKEVIITTRGTGIARDLDRFSRAAFQERLSRQKVTIHTGLFLGKIENKMALFKDASGANKEIKADTIVLAGGFLPNRNLFDELEKIRGLECYAVGDCVAPGMIFDAVHAGYQAAYTLK
jgi:2,4-dienoyl-CoA reductase-like NADH-dependent reductase (Old Yellow Enzyme family)/thioredoxin reductase